MPNINYIFSSFAAWPSREFVLRVFQMADAAIARPLFKTILLRISRLGQLAPAADMTMAAFVRTEMEQDPMGRCIWTPANSAESLLRWPLLNRERHRGAAMTSEFILISSVCAFTMVNNVSVAVMGVHTGYVGSIY